MMFKHRLQLQYDTKNGLAKLFLSRNLWRLLDGWDKGTG